MLSPAFIPFSLNLRGIPVVFERPVVMGILNVTDDSFFEESRVNNPDALVTRAGNMIAAGADILDIGACSTRPGSCAIDKATEATRISAAIKAIRKEFPSIPVSIDTFRASVAEIAISEGADIINDISGGDLDPEMFPLIARARVPYIIMHTRGNSSEMTSLTEYGSRGVTATVFEELGKKINRLALSGVNDIIIDPGFGFAKTLEQNYELLRNLPAFRHLGCPLLVGISRKSMLTRLLGISSAEALSPTTALNAFALDLGASVLRVHDVREARQCVEIFSKLSMSDNK